MGKALFRSEGGNCRGLPPAGLRGPVSFRVRGLMSSVRPPGCVTVACSVSEENTNVFQSGRPSQVPQMFRGVRFLRVCVSGWGCRCSSFWWFWWACDGVSWRLWFVRL